MSIPCLRFIKLPDRDAWVPSYVVKKNDDLSAFYILIEFGQCSIASKLLGDTVNLHTIDNKPLVGAWVNETFKTTWRMSSSTVPHGKALQSSTTLELEDISEAFINNIADPTEPPLPPQQHSFQATGEASASSSSGGVFPYPPMPSHAPPYVASGPHPHQPVIPQGSHASIGHGPAVSEGSLPAGSTNPVTYGASEGLNQYQHVPSAEGLPPHHVVLPSVNQVLPSAAPMAMNYGYPTGYGAGFPLLPPVPQPPPALGTHGVNFEVPQFAPFSGNNDAIDSTTRHYAKREANSADLPNKRQFTGFNDDRAVADVIKSVNHLSCSNGWGALEYYFFLTRLLDETVSREVRPLPQQTHSACAREVMRICQLLSQLHKSSDTDYIRKLVKWNSLYMGDRQQLGDYLKAFDSIRLDIERQQGYPFEDRFLASKLTASLRGAHHEAALTRMKALTYRQLLHELVELDRLRQLSSHQRGRSDPSQGRKDDPLPKVPLNQMTASTSTTTTNQSSTQQPTQGSNGHGKGSHDRQRRQRPKLRCTRCMDGDPNCKAGASFCPAPSPLKKEGRCPYCNRPSVKCTGVCPKRDSVRCDRCSQQHHTSHCPNSLTKSTDPTLDTMTLSLSVESLSFTPPSSTTNGPLKAFCSTTQPTTSPLPVIASPVLNLDNTLQSLRDMPSSLRNVEFNFLTKDGRCPGFTGLLDSGSQLLACSDSGLLRLQQANVALEPTGVTCVATLAVSRRVNSCPIYKITYCHKGLRVQTFIALVHGLARDFIFSCDVLRRVQNPVLWVFNPSGDRIISLVDTTPQVATAWKAFIDAVDLSRSAPPDDPPNKVAVGLNSIDLGDTQPPTVNLDEHESCFNKDSVIPLPVVDDFSNVADDDLTNGSVSTSFMQLLFSEPCPLVTLASLPVTDTLVVYSDPVPSKQVSTPSPPPHRFVHHLRWRTGHRPTNSHIPFLKRSSTLAHQLRRKGLFDAYDAEIRGFVQKGYVKPVPREEVRFWLHHFPVIKKGSQEGSVNRSSMRLRPVFDGSPLSKFIDASLPEGLHQGVPQSLGLLRRYEYFVALDIVQAFLQIELPLVHTPAFWRDENSREFSSTCRTVIFSRSRLARSREISRNISSGDARVRQQENEKLAQLTSLRH